MALFELDQEFGTGPEEEWKPPTFKDCAAADIDLAFFQENEHAEWHTVDGKKALIILYTSQTVLYIRAADYGPKPKVGKHLVLDKGTKTRTFSILTCEDQAGVYRMTMERTRQ